MAESRALSTANKEFTASLYQALFPGLSSKNLIFSPLILHACLAMVGEGARGETKTELFKGLKYNEINETIIGERYNSLMSGFQAASRPETFTLLTAKRVYSQTGYTLNQTFVKYLKNYFQAEFEQLDFSKPEKSKEAIQRINTWVETTTNNKIKNLISQDVIGPKTCLVIVNGIYFKGFWEHRFDPEQTSKAKFQVTGSKQVEVDMMNKQEKFPYGELPKLNAEAVALPYKGGKLSMVIILPKDVDGLGRIQSSIGTILQGGKTLVGDALSVSHKVDVKLPKFKIEATVKNLTETLQTMGIKSIFSSSKADFSGIPNGRHPGLFVSTVIHKAFIEINEDGAEAVAATAAVMMAKSRPTTIPFAVDHPFYFQIVDHANGDLVLFSGHCNNPTK